MPFRNLLRSFTCLSVLLCAISALPAATISGTVKDSSGAVVPGATVEISVSGQAPIQLTTDSKGSFASADLPAGAYRVTIRAKGFEQLTKAVELGSSAVVLELELAVAGAREEVTVGGKVSNYANSDPTYQALRANRLGHSFAMKANVTLNYDAGSFVFRRGTITFFEPVHGKTVGAVFTGEGQFTLTPLMPIDKAELRRRAGAGAFEEDFTRVVFRFSNGLSRNFLLLTSGPAETPREAQAAVADWENTLRHREEIPRSMLESFLEGDAIDNVAADTLAAVYNPSRPGFFSAYIQGVKHHDLRFQARARGGAVLQLDSPEEVALLNVAPMSLDDGIWYMGHAKEEYQKGVASSSEERRYFAAKRFKMETVIGKNRHLTSLATIDLEPLVAGERVLKFHLLPNLRVSRVTDAERKELYFIQESRKADGSFYVIFPEPCAPGKLYQITVEYAGDHVIQDAGTGSFYIGARESWYPTPNSFGERSIYELTFRVPKQYTLVSVGALQNSGVEDEMAVTRWLTPKPVAIAGFNYGDYKRTELRDEQTHTTFEGYYLPELPDYLKHRQAVESLAPHAMTEYALKVSRAEVQLCNYYFGPDGFERLYITEQPNFNFGQSWPNLVYLPISAYTDATQRYLLFGEINNKFSAFVDEVTPHEVSHQWWGHAVGWASYHDQWLSEGFAEFSASLFVEQGQGPNHDKDYRKFWERLHDEILQKQQFGASPNDAGPLWLGIRLASPRNASAYQMVTYPKGAYVLAMLRSLMRDEKGDKRFIEMMHDFVEAHRDRPASTESFKAIAEKHMPPNIDFSHNGTLDWFFNEWVYGTEIPRYTFTYEIAPAANGHVKAKLHLTQSEVGPEFAMGVPLFADFGKGHPVRIGQFPIVGSTTKTAEIELPQAPKSIDINWYREILAR
ncbi:MAG TPA: carboxypeptidase regulatory-like domain-containing protein [Bryobacteraceae bacterium]|jgi:hypothetical protein|nr:carboxypeptidase regulatory-like domain-containing protein [Bryobacteraceae bacterium]